MSHTQGSRLSPARETATQFNRASRSGKSANRTRWSLITAAGLLLLAGIAYIDGGEEPLRPIVQPVALPQASGGEAA